MVVSTLSNEPVQKCSLWEEGVHFQMIFASAVDVVIHSEFQLGGGQIGASCFVRLARVNTPFRETYKQGGGRKMNR